jgi:hypothetical protein
MGTRYRAVPAAVAAALCVPALAWAQAVDPDPRPGLRAFEDVLDRAVSRVSRMSVSFFFPAAEASHGYRLPGYGAVFIVPARALPPGRRTINVRRFDSNPPALVSEGPDAEAAPGPQPTPTPGAATAVRAGRGGGRKPAPDAVELEIRRFEAQMEEYQRQAQMMNRIAEQQFLAFYRTVHGGVAAADATGAPTLVQGPAGVSDDAVAGGQRPTAPPWIGFVEPTGAEDTRTPNRVLNDVRAAVTGALEAEGPAVTVVGPEEFLVVTVDFVSASVLTEPAVPQQTLVVRVRKRDLDERAAGRLASDELQKRIDATTY